MSTPVALVVGWLGFVGSAVTGMAIAMQANDDSTATAAGTALTIALGLAYAALALALYRPPLRR